MILDLSKPPYEIGARRCGCFDGFGNWHPNQAFVLVREVTQADWIEYLRLHTDAPASAFEIAATKRDRFFEVSTD